MDALAQRMVGSNNLIKLVAPFVKCHMEKITDECCLERMFEKHARTERLVLQKDGDGIQTPPKQLPPESESASN